MIYPYMSRGNCALKKLEFFNFSIRSKNPSKEGIWDRKCVIIRSNAEIYCNAFFVLKLNKKYY